MDNNINNDIKNEFERKLKIFAESLNSYISTPDGQWTIKGFIDTYKKLYTLSSDTKLISKVLEIHLFPKILQFADENGYELIPAKEQNYYPDISFVSLDGKHKFAVDLKTTYRTESPEFCNGFTLGSHGEYFVNRNSTKNIQFPYKDYLGHYCLGIIYTRNMSVSINKTKICDIENLNTISSVIRDFIFFVAEKWKIASDKSGSGNTANIGSINKISDIISGNGMFSRLGESWFDDYWMNYGKIVKPDGSGKITNLHEFVLYKGGNTNLIVRKPQKRKKT